MSRISFALLLLILLPAGCSQGPARIAAPSWDPAGSAERAMELWDTDKDGGLAVS